MSNLKVCEDAIFRNDITMFKESIQTIYNKKCAELLFLKVVLGGNTEFVRLVLKYHPYVAEIENNLAVRWTSNRGYVGILKLLIKNSYANVTVDNNYPFRIAVSNSRYNVVRTLIEAGKFIGLSMRDNDDEAIKTAIKNKDIRMLALLTLAGLELKEKYFGENIEKYNEIFIKVNEYKRYINPIDWNGYMHYCGA